jgi:putative ABC transport system ATP-binding protein
MYQLTGVTKTYKGTRAEIIALLEKLWKDLGLTLILVTHDSAVARRAQRVGQMRDGRLAIEQDTRVP